MIPSQYLSVLGTISQNYKPKHLSDSLKTIESALNFVSHKSQIRFTIPSKNFQAEESGFLNP